MKSCPFLTTRFGPHFALLAWSGMFLLSPALLSASDFFQTGNLQSRRAAHSATRLLDGRILIAGGYTIPVGASAVDTAEVYDSQTGLTTPVGGMTTPRRSHTATLLPDGRVLITGGSSNTGFLASAEIYDPGTGTFALTSRMTVARSLHTATLIEAGGCQKVLIVGGLNPGYLGTAELYDVKDATWEPTGRLLAARIFHTATLLSDGRVLVCGGRDSGFIYGIAEVYDPSSGEFTRTGNLLPRMEHAASPLADGRVLVTGGEAPPRTFLATAEVYDPSRGTFQATGSLANRRSEHTATLLPTGEVLVTGGRDRSGIVLGSGTVASAELYNASTGTFRSAGEMTAPRALHTATLVDGGGVVITGGEHAIVAVPTSETTEMYYPGLGPGPWTPVGDLAGPRSWHTATLLTNGGVLVTGGKGPGSLVRSSAELFDPSTGVFTFIGNMSSPRFTHTASLLGDGTVLLAGGSNGSFLPVASSEIYDPTMERFVLTGTLNRARSEHTATVLSDGKVLVVGGRSGSTIWNSAEIYDPKAGTFTLTGSLSVPRSRHSATLLADGSVLIVGGEATGPPTTVLASAELYDPISGKFRRVGSLESGRSAQTATRLPSGQVLITGGYSIGRLASHAELYDPISQTFSLTRRTSAGAAPYIQPIYSAMEACSSLVASPRSTVLRCQPSRSTRRRPEHSLLRHEWSTAARLMPPPSWTTAQS